MSTFADLGLSESILKVIEELGYEKPTPIQEKSIPILLNEDRDFIGLAQTGTGKTAAFGLPLIESVDLSERYTQCLVLAPTRELGQQIAVQIESFSKYIPEINVLPVYGGTNIMNQIKELRRKPQIVIATPGRLIDLVNRKAMDLSKINCVVLDEADEMLNMGFKEDIDKILSYTPDDKLTWLFSATMPSEIRRIVSTYMDNPAEVKTGTGNELNKNIEHQFVNVKVSDKTESLSRFMDAHNDMRGIVFCRTRRDTQNVADDLRKMKYRAEAIHGDLSQQQRDKVMRRFKNHELQVLVATDVAARGIDVNDLTHVVHYSLPEDIPYYTHRSGRTARAGKKGISLAFVTGRDRGKLNYIAKALKINFEQVQVPKAKDIMFNKMTQWAIDVAEAKSTESPSEEVMANINTSFEDMSKEDLIEKLVAFELTKLNFHGKERDLNDTSSRSGRDDRGSDRGRGRDRDRDRGGRRDSRDSRSSRGSDRGDRDNKSGDSTFFINIGKMDSVNKQELVEFISEQGGIPKQGINDLRLEKNCAYFDVEKKHTRGLSDKFEGMVVDGREIRVNEDHPSSQRSGGFKKGGRRSDDRGGRRSDSGSGSRPPRRNTKKRY